jgi:hypothetical protein
MRRPANRWTGFSTQRVRQCSKECAASIHSYLTVWSREALLVKVNSVPGPAVLLAGSHPSMKGNLKPGADALRILPIPPSVVGPLLQPSEIARARCPYAYASEAALDSLRLFCFRCPGGTSRTELKRIFPNLMTCALVIGGESWLNKVYVNSRKSPKFESAKTIHDLYEQAHERGADHAAHIASIRHRS